MRDIDIRKQPRLGLSRTLRLTLHGIRYRLFRSFVTVAVIAVAVAFLMNILCEGLVKRAVVRSVAAQVREMRQAPVWVSRLSHPGTLDALLVELANSAEDKDLARELTGFAGTTQNLDPVQADEALGYAAFFAGLDYGSRRLLVHTATGTGVFDWLQDPANWARFERELKNLKSRRLPNGNEEFAAFRKRWPELRTQLNSIRAGRETALAALGRELAGRSVLDALCDADGAFGDAVRKVGFALAPATAAVVAEQARQATDIRTVERTLLDPGIQMRKVVAAYRDMLPQDVNTSTLWTQVETRPGAQWYLTKLNERLNETPDLAAVLRDQGVDVSALTAERLVDLAAVKAREQSLARATRAGVDETGHGWFGMGRRMSWLVLVSMVVCVVGIANAMLMAVTERFREIATLKCLGALDGFIMTMFVFEACILGVAGGIVGAVLGVGIGLLRMFAGFGPLLFGALPVGDLCFGVVIALAAGVLLAAVAALGPSFKAARLAPMEAMRIE